MPGLGTCLPCRQEARRTLLGGRTAEERACPRKTAALRPLAAHAHALPRTGCLACQPAPALPSVGAATSPSRRTAYRRLPKRITHAARAITLAWARTSENQIRRLQKREEFSTAKQTAHQHFNHHLRAFCMDAQPPFSPLPPRTAFSGSLHFSHRAAMAARPATSGFFLQNLLANKRLAREEEDFGRGRTSHKPLFHAVGLMPPLLHFAA